MSEPPSSIVLFRRIPAGVRPVALERYARVLRDEVAGGISFECLITNDRELQRLNLDFRGKDSATDVLSFPAGRNDDGSGPGFLGSLAVSWQRAAAQAREFGHSLETELRILMLHGILHLLGMDHETDRGRMARAEARWRARLRLPNGLIERARR
jgi:probable rRNA maturation factor